MDAAAGKISTLTDRALQASLLGALAVTTPDGTTIAVSRRRLRTLLASLHLSADEAPDRNHAKVSKLLWPSRNRRTASRNRGE